MSSMTTTDNKAFLNELARLVGSSHLLTDPAKTARYRKGFRSGQGDALAVVFPGSLLELWRVLKACVTADKIILMQAANTGLTEGSTPNGNDYDRDIVIISTLRLDKLHVLGKGEQVLAYPGTTLYSLEKALKPLGREPHSVIGSSCIGASVIGGICNNSGGSLVQRGPAYTEMSLFARINEDGKLTLVNKTGESYGKVYVYYKYVQLGGAYLGGITYRVPFENVPANGQVESVAGHFRPEGSKIVGVVIMPES